MSQTWEFMYKYKSENFTLQCIPKDQQDALRESKTLDLMWPVLQVLYGIVLSPIYYLHLKTDRQMNIQKHKILVEV